MKSLILMLGILMGLNAMAQTPTPSPSPYNGPTSSMLQAQINLKSDQQVLNALQCTQNAAKSAAQIEKMTEQLNAVKAAGN